MLVTQVIANGLVLGGIYGCIAAGFSLVWGVLNIINILHGSLILLGAYIAFFAHQLFGIHPFMAIVPAAALLFAAGYLLQAVVINRVINATVLVTLTLTFGLNLMLDNAMIVAFKADFRKVTIDGARGSYEILGAALPADRLAGMGLAVLIVAALYLLLKYTRMGRAIVAVRMDRDAAALMGVNVVRTYALTFAIGAALAGAAGAILSMIFPISPTTSSVYLGKAFIVCVLGGLGSVPGVLVGGIALGLVESAGAVLLGPDHALTIAFLLLIVLLLVRPQGIMGRKGYQ